MQKEIHIIKGTGAESYKSFVARMFSLSDLVMKEKHPKTLKISLTTSAPPALSVIPFRRAKLAVISMECEGDKSPDIIQKTEAYVGSYQVEEAEPVSYTKTWEDQSPTPGVCLLTLFHKKPGLTQDEFLHRWFQGHTPLSLRLHPLWNYNRNVVKKKLVEESPWYDGIVEEQFRKASELLNPFIFFGPPLKVPGHMMEVWKDSRSFIHMKRIETYLASEYHMKSQLFSE